MKVNEFYSVNSSLSLQFLRNEPDFNDLTLEQAPNWDALSALEKFIKISFLLHALRKD